MQHYGKVILKGDTFGICDRLKAIDDSYYVVYNRVGSRFEVHSTAQGVHSLCVTVPYPSLDCRTVELVQRTRVCNVNKLAADMEKANAAGGGIL